MLFLGNKRVVVLMINSNCEGGRCNGTHPLIHKSLLQTMDETIRIAHTITVFIGVGGGWGMSSMNLSKRANIIAR